MAPLYRAFHPGVRFRSGLNLSRSSVGPVVHLDSELDLIDLDLGVDVVHVQVGCDYVGLAWLPVDCRQCDLEVVVVCEDVAEGGVPPTKAQWVALESLRRYYGVMYGDECTETITRTVSTYDPSGTDAYMYMAEGQTKGMQGVFIWDDSRGGNHTFFPLSATGFGHRKAADLYSYSWGLNPANIKYGVLQYGQRSSYFPDTSTGWDGKNTGDTAINITVASAVPVFYDLWLRKGVIYWYRNRSLQSGKDGDNDAEYDYAHDFNYFTMGFETYGANNLERTISEGTKDCDLCFIRCVVP